MDRMPMPARHSSESLALVHSHHNEVTTDEEMRLQEVTWPGEVRNLGWRLRRWIKGPEEGHIFSEVGAVVRE